MRSDFSRNAKTAQIAVAVLLTIATAANAGVIVTDGDTLKMAVSSQTPTCSRRHADGMERIRVMPHDAPELEHARCPAERAMAMRSRERLQHLLAGGGVQILRYGCDAYGRTKARVLVDGRDVAATMLSEGLVIPFRPRQSQERPGPWCR